MMLKSIFIFVKLLPLVTTICTEVEKMSKIIPWEKKMHYRKQSLDDSCYSPFNSYSVSIVLKQYLLLFNNQY